MNERTASCSCGQLRLTFEGDPVRVSVCHCTACQQRTGSAFGVQARFRRDQLTRIEGTAKSYVRVADSGGEVPFRFCPECGSTLYWEALGPEFVAVAVGAFADATFPEPGVSVYEDRQASWVRLETKGELQRIP
jgi:hypothetical protein